MIILDTSLPGPWRVEQREGTMGVCHRVVASNGNTVCDNETYYPAPVEPEVMPLIAAAPAMRDMLAEVEEWLRYNRTPQAQELKNKIAMILMHVEHIR